MHVREVGAGNSVVVVLGGTGCPVEHYDELVRSLAREHRVLFPCFPGYGETLRSPGLTFASELRTLEDALLAKGASAVRVVGFSMGTLRGLALASSGRVCVTHLALLGAMASLTAEDRAKYRQFAQLARSHTVPAGLATQQFVSAAYAAAHPEAVTEVESWISRMDLDAFADELERLAGAETLTPDDLRAIDAPIVARVGDQDVATPIAKSEEIVRHARNARLEVVPGAGHVLLTEDSEATLASVRAALAG